MRDARNGVRTLETAFTHTHTHTCTHTHTHLFTLAHTHRHTCARKRQDLSALPVRAHIMAAGRRAFEPVFLPLSSCLVHAEGLARPPPSRRSELRVNLRTSRWHTKARKCATLSMRLSDFCRRVERAWRRIRTMARSLLRRTASASLTLLWSLCH